MIARWRKPSFKMARPNVFQRFLIWWHGVVQGHSVASWVDHRLDRHIIHCEDCEQRLAAVPVEVPLG